MAQIIPHNIYYTSYLSKHILDQNKNAITLEESNETYAKQVVINNVIKYYILSKNNMIYNPFTIYRKNTHKSLYDKERKFIRVTPKIFDMYVKFLNSQNLSLLYNIQREVLI